MQFNSRNVPPQLWGQFKSFSQKGVGMGNFRQLLTVIVSLLLASCAVGTTAPVAVTELTPDAPVTETVSPIVKVQPPAGEADGSVNLDRTAETTEPDAWETIIEAQNDPSKRDSKLLEAALMLLSKRQNSDAERILELIDITGLSAGERIDRRILAAQLAQDKNQHKSALRELSRLQRSDALSADQRRRIAWLKAYSNSVLDRPVDLANEFVRLYSLLSEDRKLRLDAGHKLWATLSRMTVDELSRALRREADPIARQWYVLALALGLNSVRTDPHEYGRAVNNWRRENPEHPANELIDAGLAPGSHVNSKIALLLPLTSVNRNYVQALLNGFMAQYEADTDPLKPQIEVIDIGAEPTNATLFYYQAVDNGADFIIGPLGVGHVNEMVQYVDFIVPTLLLGETQKPDLPEFVFQFALAPEHSGSATARRAWQDGHATALVIKSPQQWSNRAFAAFSDEWKQLGGHIIRTDDYELNQDDYSETAKQALLINASAGRYQAIRTMMGQTMKFVPRRRQDVDFIFLVADSAHGRLVKPYLDFQKAYDLPVYSTSHIYLGRVNKIRDQDLNGIRFSDMDWILDRSEKMQNLRSSLEGEGDRNQNYDRLFGMGVDLYGLIPRINTLSRDENARFHGVTSIIHMTQNGKLRRSARWAVFNDGIPELIPGIKHPELAEIPTYEWENGTLPTADKPE